MSGPHDSVIMAPKDNHHHPTPATPTTPPRPHGTVPGLRRLPSFVQLPTAWQVGPCPQCPALVSLPGSQSTPPQPGLARPLRYTPIPPYPPDGRVLLLRSSARPSPAPRLRPNAAPHTLTSPDRRFADVLVHRLLASALGKGAARGAGRGRSQSTPRGVLGQLRPHCHCWGGLTGWGGHL